MWILVMMMLAAGPNTKHTGSLNYQTDYKFQEFDSKKSCEDMISFIKSMDKKRNDGDMIENIKSGILDMECKKK